MCKFFRRRDTLDYRVEEVLNVFMEKAHSLEGTDFPIADVTDLAHALRSLDSVLQLSFFERTTLGFRLLRRSLDLNLVNHATEDNVLAIEVSDADREDLRILEHIWFLLFIGAQEDQISACLRTHRMNMTEPQRNRGYTLRNGPTNTRSRQVPRSIINQDVRQIDLNNDAAAQNSSPYYSNDPVYRRNPIAAANNDGRSTHKQGSNHYDIPQRSNCHRHSSSFVQSYDQRKKGCAVETYLRDRKFSGYPEQSIDNAIRDFEICSTQ